MSGQLRAVIVDDIPAAIENLRQILADFVEEIDVIDTADSVVRGAKLIKDVKPDIVFLDIEMPDGTGFDLIDLLPEDIEARIVFTTGSEEYAIKAFRYAAVDYLLKPIDPDDLVSAVNKVMTQSVTAGVVQNVMKNKSESGIPTKIALHTSDEVLVVEIDDIVRCQSFDNYCHIYLSSGDKILMSKPLKHFATMLEGVDFIRVHQSHLVNYNYVRSFVKKEGGYLLLKDNTQIPVSMRKRALLMEKMSG